MTLVKIRSFLGALDNSQQPVIIGAAPPADSGHARAQQIYADGTIDYNGPHCLPPSKAATRIKKGVAHNVKTTEHVVATNHPADLPQRCVIFANAKEDNTIIISSGTDSPPVYRPAKSKAGPKKKKTKYILVPDSSEDEAVVDVGEKVVGEGLVGEAEAYEEPGPSLKRKAKELQTSRPVKRPTLTAESKPAKVAPKKGKQRASDHAHKNTEDSSSESDFPDLITIRGTYLYSMTTSFTYICNSSNGRTSWQSAINRPCSFRYYE